MVKNKSSLVYVLIFLTCCILIAKSTELKNETLTTNSTEFKPFELTYENFETTTDNNDIFLIYEADGCAPCKTHRPLFLQVANEMIKSFPNLLIASVDVELY